MALLLLSDTEPIWMVTLCSATADKYEGILIPAYPISFPTVVLSADGVVELRPSTRVFALVRMPGDLTREELLLPNVDVREAVAVVKMRVPVPVVLLSSLIAGKPETVRVKEAIGPESSELAVPVTVKAPLML